MKKQTIFNWDKLSPVLTMQDVSLIFGVTEGTIKRWLYNGTIEGVKIGRFWRFDREYIKGLVNQL